MEIRFRLATLVLFALGVPSLWAEEPPWNGQIEIDDSGYRRVFEVAEDELCVRPAQGDPRVPKVPDFLRAANSYQQAIQLHEGNGGEVGLVLYEKGVPRTEANRRVSTKRVLVKLEADSPRSAIAHRVGAFWVRPLEYGPGYFIFETKDPVRALEMARALRRTSGVVSAEPLLGRRLSRKFVPNDRLLRDQWFLLNTGQTGGKAGIDLNVTNAWDKYRGRGVTIAIVDDGLQLTHPDLAQNPQTALHHDYRDGDRDPSPSGSDDFHGTPVAGIAAARGNNLTGTSGVAFEATLVGIRLVGGNVQTDEQSAAAIIHSNQVVHVSNNSWGAEDDGKRLEGPGPLMQMALERAVQTGRGGKGTIFVWSAGNGGEVQDNANYDGYVNSMNGFTVAALNDLGKQAAYSEPGACLIAAVPSNAGDDSRQEGIATTDLFGEEGLNYSLSGGDFQDINYTRNFGGTSAAAPMASGVIALVLEANPNLGWRDVKEILIRSATRVDPGDADWINNGAGFSFNHKYGAGLLNASAAVTLATNWTNLGPQTNLFREQSNTSYPIPDNDPNGTTLLVDFRTGPPVRVEHAVVTVTIGHPRRGDLAITLISPSGTRSRLAEPHSDTNADYPAWKFMSLFNWGESSQGEWKIQISDLRPNSSGTIRGVRLDLFGTDAPALSRPSLTVLGFEAGQLKLRLTAQPGYRYEIQTSTNLVNWTQVLSTNLTSGSSFETRIPKDSDVWSRFFRAVRQPLAP